MTTVSPHRSLSIEWASKNKIRSRKVVSRSNSRVTGKFPSSKVGRMIQWESQIERDAITLLEVDKDVITYQEQPARLVFRIDEGEHEHFPDFLIKYKDKHVFREIKDYKSAQDPFIISRTKHLCNMLPLYGFEYELFTENDIRIEPVLSNASYLLRYGNHSIDIAEYEIAFDYLRKNSSVSLNDIKLGCFGKYGISAICKLILNGIATINLNETWNEHTLITLA